MMKRRDFLRFLATASAGAATASLIDPLRPRLSFAQTGAGKTLVVVFQRGGNDGVNTVVPFGDAGYYTLRPTIGVPPPSAGNPAAALALNGFGAPTNFFGLHPGLGALLPLWSAGQLAVLPACHYPNASQSHFDGQENLESGAPSATLDGWLNRHLITLPRPAALRAVGFGDELPHALRGSVVVSAFNDIANFTTGLPADQESPLLADLSRVYSQNPDNAKAYRALVYEHGRAVVNDLAVLSDINPATYAPANGAVYPNSTYGRQMRQIAQLIKSDLGLEVAALSIGGWDTHSGQGAGESNGSQARRHQDFAGGIAALLADLGAAAARDVTVVTMTEFGRTSAENGSGGTDHGHAAAWFVAGGSVRGGVYGAWPGLATPNLLRGRYLNHSIDFRNVMGDVLVSHLGNPDVGNIIPGHTYQPVGVMA
ncbi:MAG: DUF1501 domain-containing protein [Candidatus Binatia bacterium]